MRAGELLLCDSVRTTGVAAHLLTPPLNTLRVALHPEGMAPRIANFPEYSAHLVGLLHRQAVLTGDSDLLELEKELRGYPGVGDAPSHDALKALFVPLVFRMTDKLQLSFFNTLTTFGTALDITLSELTIEALYPADEATSNAVRVAWG